MSKGEKIVVISNTLIDWLQFELIQDAMSEILHSEPLWLDGVKRHLGGAPDCVARHFMCIGYIEFSNYLRVLRKEDAFLKEDLTLGLRGLVDVFKTRAKSQSVWLEWLRHTDVSSMFLKRDVPFESLSASEKHERITLLHWSACFVGSLVGKVVAKSYTFCDIVSDGTFASDLYDEQVIKDSVYYSGAKKLSQEEPSSEPRDRYIKELTSWLWSQKYGLSSHPSGIWNRREGKRAEGVIFEGKMDPDEGSISLKNEVLSFTDPVWSYDNPFDVEVGSGFGSIEDYRWVPSGASLQYLGAKGEPQTFKILEDSGAYSRHKLATVVSFHFYNTLDKKYDVNALAQWGLEEYQEEIFSDVNLGVHWVKRLPVAKEGFYYQKHLANFIEVLCEKLKGSEFEKIQAQGILQHLLINEIESVMNGSGATGREKFGQMWRVVVERGAIEEALVPTSLSINHNEIRI